MAIELLLAAASGLELRARDWRLLTLCASSLATSDWRLEFWTSWPLGRVASANELASCWLRSSTNGCSSVVGAGEVRGGQSSPALRCEWAGVWARVGALVRSCRVTGNSAELGLPLLATGDEPAEVGGEQDESADTSEAAELDGLDKLEACSMDDCAWRGWLRLACFL